MIIFPCFPGKSYWWRPKLKNIRSLPATSDLHLLYLIKPGTSNPCGTGPEVCITKCPLGFWIFSFKKMEICEWQMSQICVTTTTWQNNYAWTLLQKMAWLFYDLHTAVWSGSNPFQTLISISFHIGNSSPWFAYLEREPAAYVGWVETHHLIRVCIPKKEVLLNFQVCTRNNNNNKQLDVRYIADHNNNNRFERDPFIYIFT